MGLDPATITVAGLVLSAVTSFAGIAQANASAKAQAKAQEQNLAFKQEEATRQQRRVNEIAKEKKSDVIRRAESELGTVRAMVGDVGGGGNSLVRLLGEIGATEGLDLSRIEGNRSEDIESLQASKKSASLEYSNNLATIYSQKQAAITGEVFGFIGSGLQIGASYYDRNVQKEILENKGSG